MRGATLALLMALVAAGCTAPAPGGLVALESDAGPFDTSGPYARVRTPGPYAPLPDEVTTIPSAIDGAAIQIGVVRPDVPEGARVPVLLFAGPYVRDVARFPVRDALAGDPGIPQAIDELLPHGYAVALVPARGVGGSGGCYTWWGADEAADLDQAITWLASQPWSDGQVAPIGLSLTGSAAWMAAASGNPAVKTIVPIGSEPDFHTWFVRNGTVMLYDTTLGTTAFFAAFGMDPRSRDPSTSAATTRDCPDVARGLAASVGVTATGERDPFGFSAARDMRPAVEERYRGSILLVHGLRDALAHPHLVEPWVPGLEAQGIRVERLLGQWGHVQPDVATVTGFSDSPPNPTPRWDYAEHLLGWLDRELKGAAGAERARVQVADTSGRWRAEDAWPPADARQRILHLAADRTLGASPGARGSALVAADPARALTPLPPDDTSPRPPCPGCAEFTTAPLDAGLRFAGLPQLHLTVTPTGPGGHLAAHLFARDAQGDRALAWAIMDLRFADGGEVARPVVPGQALEMKMEFEPTDAHVPPGAQLVLVLSQGGYGERLHPTTAPAAATPGGYYRASLPPHPVQVELGNGLSTLSLQTFERSDDDARFFAPP